MCMYILCIRIGTQSTQHIYIYICVYARKHMHTHKIRCKLTITICFQGKPNEIVARANSAKASHIRAGAGHAHDKTLNQAQLPRNSFAGRSTTANNKNLDSPSRSPLRTSNALRLPHHCQLQASTAQHSGYCSLGPVK